MSRFGRLLSAPTIERGVEVCLRYYLGLYLGEVLVQAGHDRYALPDPSDLVRVSEFQWPTPAQLTLVVVASPGTVGEARREADGYSAVWDIRAAVLADLGDVLETREAAQFYAAAAGAAIAEQGVAVVNPDGTWLADEEGFGERLEGSSVKWLGESYRRVGPPTEHRALIAGEARLSVSIELARTWKPDQPIPLPEAPTPPVREPEAEGPTSPVDPSLTIERDRP